MVRGRTLFIALAGGSVLAFALLAIGDGVATQAQTADDSLPTATPAPALPPLPGIPRDANRATSFDAYGLILQLQELAEAPPAASARPVARASSASAPAPPGIDVIVNNTALDTPETTTQSETTLAVRGSTICAGYVDTGAGIASISGLSRSPDLGATWTDLGSLGLLQLADPVLAVHQASGTFYYADLVLLLPGLVWSIGVARSTDDCNTFGPPVDASQASNGSSHFQDKPWITVDNSGGPGDGNAYVCWTRFVDNSPGPATSGEIRFSRSTDGGVTFVNEQVISPPTDSFPFGCHIDVGPGGEVSVAWSDRNFDYPIRFRRSLDSGLTWQAAVQVNSLPIRAPGSDRVIECEAGQFRTTLNGDIRMLPQAWMAVDTTGGPFDGNIYVVWANDPPGAADNSDVFFSSSGDGGLSWATEVQIAGGTLTDQFEPFVEVGGQGTVSIAWYDRRNDPVNNFSIDVYQTFSTNGGATLGPITRLTDVSFPVPPLKPQFDLARSDCYMGEYIAIAADATNFYYAWGDNRNTVVSTSFPSGRPDPDVFFERQAIPQPTPTPKNPTGDTDGDTIPNETDPNDDNDACTDVQELGPDEAFGGRRNPHNFWDWFDPNQDGSVTVLDFFALLQRFAAVGDPGIDPLSEPDPAPAYHTRFDRGPVVGKHPWNAGPPDGAIVVTDFFALLAQFGHTCA